MNVIMKFGGTSVADAEAMDRVIAIVRDHLAKQRAGHTAGRRRLGDVEGHRPSDRIGAAGR